MSTLAQILEEKGAQVFTITPEATVLEAARLMNQHKIGSLMVVKDGHIRGILTERDVLRRVVAEAAPPDATTVEATMTREVTCATPDMPTDEARTVMMQRRIRHLPVLGADDHLLGIVSIGDLNAHRLQDKEATIHFLREYLYGVA